MWVPEFRRRPLPTALVLGGALLLAVCGDSPLHHNATMLDVKPAQMTLPLAAGAAAIAVGWLSIPFPRVRGAAAIAAGLLTSWAVGEISVLRSDPMFAPTMAASVVFFAGILVAVGGAVRLAQAAALPRRVAATIE